MIHKSFGEKIRDFFIKMGKKYRILLPLAAVCLFFTMLIINLFSSIKNSGKKLTCTVFVACFCILVSSFSYPIFNYTNSFVSEEDKTDISVTESDIILTNEVNENPVVIISDNVNDSITEYGTVEASEAVSLDDILVNYDINNNKDESGNEHSEFDVNDWRLILVNKQHPIPEDYEFTLGKLSGSMQCDSRIIDDLLLMMKEAKEQGVILVICSPYRDIQKQESLFRRKINNYMKNGYSYMDAYKLTSQAVTIPGASEHQLGLAIDIITPTYTVLEEGFEDTLAGIWLREHCAEYGFILRYPKGKESITSIEYEPWHFRYVGHSAAKVIMDEGICLEEFWDLYL